MVAIHHQSNNSNKYVQCNVVESYTAECWVAESKVEFCKSELLILLVFTATIKMVTVAGRHWLDFVENGFKTQKYVSKFISTKISTKNLRTIYRYEVTYIK